MGIKIGDTIMVRGCFGREAPRQVVVESMEITEAPRSKYGAGADEVSWDLVRQNRVLFDLDNGHWAYSDQVVLPESNIGRYA